MFVRGGFVWVMLLILPIIYGKRCESEDAINICGDEVKTGSKLYLDINIQPKDNIDHCTCVLQSDQDAAQSVQFYSVPPSYWCEYTLTITKPLISGRFDCRDNTPALLFNVKHTETLDILLQKEIQPTSNFTRCVWINSATNVSISCNGMTESSPATTTSNTPKSPPTQQPTDTSLTSTNGEATTTIIQSRTTTPTPTSSATNLTSAIPSSSKTSISLMITNTTSFTASTTDSSTTASTSETGGESTTSSVAASASDSSTSVEKVTKNPSSSYTGSEETPTETTTLYVAPDGLSDTQVQYIIIGVAAGVVVIIIIVIVIILCIRKKKRKNNPPNVPLEHINPGFTDDESDYGNNTIHNNKNTINQNSSEDNGHYAVVPDVYDSRIAKVQPLPRDDSVEDNHVTDDYSVTDHYALTDIDTPKTTKAQLLPKDASAEDNHVTDDDSVIDHYTLSDIDAPKTTKQQNTTIGEMGQHKSIPSSMNPKHKSKRQPILPVDVKDLYAVVNKPIKEGNHEPEQSQDGIDVLYAVPNKPKKQQVGDSSTTETKDDIENKATTEDNESALNESTNILQEISTMDTDNPLNSETDTCTVESTAL